jgi:hypothetical protein
VAQYRRGWPAGIEIRMMQKNGWRRICRRVDGGIINDRPHHSAVHLPDLRHGVRRIGGCPFLSGVVRIADGQPLMLAVVHFIAAKRPAPWREKIALRAYPHCCAAFADLGKRRSVGRHLHRHIHANRSGVGRGPCNAPVLASIIYKHQAGDGCTKRIARVIHGQRLGDVVIASAFVITDHASL